MTLPKAKVRVAAAAALVLAAVLLSAAAVAAGVQRGHERRQVSQIIGRYEAVFGPSSPAKPSAARSASGPASAAATASAATTASAPASSAAASRGRSSPATGQGARPAPPEQAAKGAKSEKDAKADKALEEQVQQICRRNVFGPPKPPKEGFKAKLVGVLGQMAYFEGSQGQSVGDNFNGATIKAIGPDWVEIEVDGNKRRLSVFEGGGGGGDGPSPEGPRGRGGPRPPMMVSGGGGGGGMMAMPARMPTSGPVDEAQMRAMMEAARAARAERMRAMGGQPGAASQP